MPASAAVRQRHPQGPPRRALGVASRFGMPRKERSRQVAARSGRIGPAGGTGVATAAPGTGSVGRLASGRPQASRGRCRRRVGPAVSAAHQQRVGQRPTAVSATCAGKKSNRPLRVSEAPGAASASLWRSSVSATASIRHCARIAPAPRRRHVGAVPPPRPPSHTATIVSSFCPPGARPAAEVA
jgi:hypothetical protein